MKILYWVHEFLPDIGGIQTLSAQLLPLLKRNHDVIVVTSHGKRKMPDKSLFAGAPVYRFPINQAISTNDLTAVIRIRKAVQELIRAFQPDIIHLHPSGPELLFHLQISRVMPMPTILTIHNNYSLQNVKLSDDTGFGKALRQADWVTAVSNDALAWLRAGIPSLKFNSSVVHNGIPSQPLSPQPLPWKPAHLLYVGRLAPQKGLDILLDAFSLVLARFPSTKLMIVGEGVERVALESQAAALNITAHIEFKGRVEPQAVPALLNQATMFVMSSLYEGLPMVALEAAQMGRPIVATRAGGLPEAVIHNRTGLLVEPQNPAALADAIITLLSDPQRATRYGAAGRALVEEHFTIETCAAAYEQHYHRLLSPTVGVPLAEAAY